MRRKKHKKQRSRVRGKVKLLTEAAGLVGHSHLFVHLMECSSSGWLESSGVAEGGSVAFPTLPCSSSWCGGVRDTSGLKLNQGKKSGSSSCGQRQDAASGGNPAVQQLETPLCRSSSGGMVHAEHRDSRV